MIVTSTDASPQPDSACRLGPLDVLVLSAWCGLASGELEVIAKVACAYFSSTQGLYLMPRHFVWLIPLVNLSLFVGAGLFLSAAILVWPRRVGWLSPRLIGAFAILPTLMVVGHRVLAAAWLMVAAGLASL